MKKTLWTIVMGMLFILTSCQSEEDFAPTPQTTKAGLSHFYGVKTVKDQPETRGVAQRDKLWNPGTVITVKLLNDPYNMTESIKTWASEWEEYADIKFDFVASGNANVRIGFDWNGSKWVTWSYTGTDCKFIRDQKEATVNFAYWDSASELDKKGDVLRAFGQVLGLEFEHRHLSFDAGWTSRISQYWEGEISDIPWDELKEYVFDPIDERNLVQTAEYDANSIMIWPFDRKYATNTARDYNYALSAQDKKFINSLYPKQIAEVDGELIASFTIDPSIANPSINNIPEELRFSFYFETNSTTSPITIKHNGREQTFVPTIGAAGIAEIVDLADLGRKEYTIEIYGDPKILTAFSTDCRQYTVSEYDVAWNSRRSAIVLKNLYFSPECTEMTKIETRNFYADNQVFEKFSQSLSSWSKLNTLEMYFSNIPTLNFSQNKELNRITLGWVDFTNSEVSAATFANTLLTTTEGLIRIMGTSDASITKIKDISNSKGWGWYY